MDNKKITNNIKIEGARLIFKNFQGKGSTYNREGDRSFGVLLDEELVNDIEADGWNVKRLKPREDDPEQYCQPWLSVKVRFDPFPPTVVLISSKGKIKLNEETIGQLDWSIIKNVDLIIRPYNYPAMQGRPAGVAAYLKTMYVTISEDELAEKYADIADISNDEEEFPFE